MNRLIPVIIIFLLAVPADSFKADSLYRSAGDHYEDKDYNQALEDYLALESNGYQSAGLYYNIGNCYFKEGKLGHAVLYYLRAKRIDPNDADIAANLQFARQFTATRLEGIKINPVTAFLNILVEPFTLNTIAWISSILFIVLMLCISIIVLVRSHSLGFKTVAYTIALFVIIFFGLTTYKYRTEYLTKGGVILSVEARIFSGPSGDNDVEFIGASGLVFQIEKSAGNFYLVKFENGRKGWLKKEHIEII